MDDLMAIVMAAGKGSRMNSGRPLVVHEICGKPVINYLFDLLREVGINNVTTVVGPEDEKLKKLIPSGFSCVLQEPQLGTADAVRSALDQLECNGSHTIVLSGNTPFISPTTVRALIDKHNQSDVGVTMLTAYTGRLHENGRIVRDPSGIFCEIISGEGGGQQEEIDAGVYIFKTELLKNLVSSVEKNNIRGEYLIEDCISLAFQQGDQVETYTCDYSESQRVNTRHDLAELTKHERRRIIGHHMAAGVTIIDPETTYIENGVEIGRDSIILPFTVILAGVTIGSNCQIGPFTHLRPGAVLAAGVKVGNFSEVKNSRVGENSRVSHLTYLGDTVVGKGVNIGAGTITANYDGKNKSKTEIADGAFVGSGSILVAPVRIGKGSITGAGAVVTKNRDVPDNTVVVGVPAKEIKK